MGFASAWLSDNALFPEFVEEAPDDRTGIIVVVPSFDEPSFTILLDSLNSCEVSDCKVEVLVVINAPADASPESIQNNSGCIQNIRKWLSDNNPFFKVHYFDTGIAPVTGWGVGLARKCGMDEAVRRFNMLENPEGVIVSLDSDCTVGKNYFTALCDDFYINKNKKACSLYFEHPLKGNQYPEVIYDNIAQYELHLRYFVQSLKFAGFPYSFHTVGSALAVKALQYVRAGGMNRKQAGEDFYFIQKLAPMGGYFSLNSTTVCPSPRESFRVPFGTGVTMKKMSGDSDNMMLTYNPEAFSDLSILFSMAAKMYSEEHNMITETYNLLPAGLKEFVTEEEWNFKLTEIQGNTSSMNTFIKRFYSWFNMFRVVKYLNYIHSTKYTKIHVNKAAAEMLALSGVKNIPDDTFSLLMLYRDMEKNQV